MSAPSQPVVSPEELALAQRLLLRVAWASAALVLLTSLAAAGVLFLETPNYRAAYAAYQVKRFPKQTKPETADPSIPDLPTDKLPAITVWLLRNSELAAVLLMLPGLAMAATLARLGAPPDPLLSAGLLALVLIGMVGCLLAIQVPLQELASPALTTTS